MSKSILKLNGTHIGKTVIIVEGGFTIRGLLCSVDHTADRVATNPLEGYPAIVQRPSCRVNIDGRGEIRLNETAAFTVA